jgi:RNA recognition motif-containing protein
MDRETGRSRGFGFVTYTSAEEAGAAITGMDGKVCHVKLFALRMSDACEPYALFFLIYNSSHGLIFIKSVCMLYAV